MSTSSTGSRRFYAVPNQLPNERATHCIQHACEVAIQQLSKCIAAVGGEDPLWYHADDLLQIASDIAFRASIVAVRASYSTGDVEDAIEKVAFYLKAKGLLPIVDDFAKEDGKGGAA